MLAVRARVPSHANELWANLGDEQLFLVIIGDRQCPLQHVVYGSNFNRRAGVPHKHSLAN